MLPDVLTGLISGGFAGGYDADDFVAFPVAVADRKQPGIRTEPDDDEPVFVHRVVGVIDEESTLITEDGLGLIKVDAMPSVVFGGLGRVPCETDRTHLNEDSVVIE